MARKIKIENLPSQFYELRIVRSVGDDDWGYVVMDRTTCAETAISHDRDGYRSIKRLWRRSKTDFDSFCRTLKFKDLFSHAGVNT